MFIQKIKRPDFVRELHPTSKKRSELTAALLKESIDLELSEGRKEVKIRVEKPPSLMKSSLTEGLCILDPTKVTVIYLIGFIISSL